MGARVLPERMIAALSRRLSIPREFDHGIYKPRVKPFLPSNPVIVEAGAHNGSDTLELSRVWRHGIVHAFEPVPALNHEVRRRTRHRRNVRTYSCALADREGTVKLWVSSGASDASSSLRPPKTHLDEHPTITFDEQIEVQSTTLDLWAASQGVDHVDFLWLDMQGYELATLQAAPQILKTVRAIVTEVFLTEQYDGAPLWPETRTWLEGAGFSIEIENLAFETGGDILAVRESA